MATAHVQDSSRRRHRVVLIIDDSMPMIALVRAALELRGFEVLYATSPFTGVRLAAEHVPHVIVMDIDMPGMDGVESTRFLKRIDQTRGIPVIAFTGQPPRALAGLPRGMFDRVVQKAEGLEGLEHELEVVLDGGALAGRD
jgi:CheY-like chemotaxis protein